MIKIYLLNVLKITTLCLSITLALFLLQAIAANPWLVIPVAVLSIAGIMTYVDVKDV